MSDHQNLFSNRCPDKVCKASIAKSKKELKRIYINLKSKSPNKDHLSDVQKYGIITPKMMESVTYCTPRFPFYVECGKVEEAIDCSKSLGIVVGDWFQNNNTFSELIFTRNKKKYVCMNLSLIRLSDKTLKSYDVFFNKIASSAI